MSTDVTAARAGRQHIGGAWVESSSGTTVALHDPTTTRELARVADGTAEDVDAAVGASRAAFPIWSRTPLDERVAVLRRAAELLGERADELAATITSEVGTPLEISLGAQVKRPIAVLTSLCDAAQAIAWVERIDDTLIVREPIGVVAAITPWNFPLHQAIAKVGAALVAGCTVVLKPSELAPLSAYALADSLLEAGLPAGAFNVVSGAGPTVGEALVVHPGVDQVSFTGSTAIGRLIGTNAAATVKRVSLELGGKGPSVVLPGADTATAAAASAARCFINSGQVCAALSRLLVPRDDLGVAEEVLAAFINEQVIGDPHEAATTMGPLVSAAQRERVRGLLELALAEGARIAAGGPEIAVPETGWFVAPTVLSDVTTDMTIAQTEVFGPVLCVMPYDSVEEAVAIANDTPYGLVAAVWGPVDDEALAVAAQLRAGMVGVNGGRINVRAPFGGYKQSGNGREFGTFGVEEFLETKSVNLRPGSDATWPVA